MANTTNQSGFGVVAIIVAILVVVGLGYVGYRVYTANTNKPASTTSNTAATQTNSSTQGSNTQTDPSAGYVAIKEWGVRFKPVSGFNGVEYSFSDDTATFTTQELRSLDANCSSQVSGVTVLGQIDRSTEASVPHYPASFAKVGDYYYYYHSPEATCSDNANVQAIETADVQYLKNSIATLGAAK